MHFRDTAGRVAPPRLVKRSDAPGKPRIIAGYGAVFYRADDPGSEYELMRYGNYRIIERLMPSAFNRAIREGQDVRGLFNHNPDQVLGRTASGTMRLTTDGVGLRFEIDVPDTSLGRDVAESIRRGDVSGSSFSFDYADKVVREVTDPDGTETAIIEVNSVILYDTGPVTFPAYLSATAGVRSAPRLAGRSVTSKGRHMLMLARLRQMEVDLRR